MKTRMSVTLQRRHKGSKERLDPEWRGEHKFGISEHPQYHIPRRAMAMAEEESETSVAASSSTGNWWNAVSSENPNSVCSWNEGNLNSWPSDHQSPNGAQNSGAEDNLSTSLTNTSNNNSTLTMESTDHHLGRQDLVESHASLLDSTVQNMQEPTSGVPDSDHIWSQVLLCVNGSNEGAQNVMQTSVGNLYEVLSSRALRTELLGSPDQAVLHPKKMEENVPTCWEFTNLTPFQAEDLNLSGIEKQVPSLHYNGQLLDDRLQYSNNYAGALTDLGSSWSIAPPDHQDHDHNSIIPRATNISMNTFSTHGLEFPTFPHFEVSGRINNIKREICDSVPYGGHLNNPSTTLFQAFGPEINHKNNIIVSHPQDSTNNKSLRKSIASGGSCSQMGSVNNIAGDHHNYPGRWQSGSRSTTNVITFGGSCTQNKQMLDFPSSKPVMRHQSRATTSHGNEGGRDSNSDHHTKKSQSTESLITSTDTVFKRPRLESNPSHSTFKMQAPKVKLGDRITALQQLVSPFGKTDTASVLLEAIGYIKFLQEQVQVLSTPYMKTGMNGQGDQKGWKDSKEPKQDLKSRGLCLVPLSCTLHVSNEDSTDYWTPSLGGSYR